MRVLGISLGTTTTGVAVVSGSQLLHARIHSFRDTWSDEKVVVITSRYERYLNQYRPKIVVVKVPPRHSHTEAIKHLLKKVATLFEYHGCMVEYTTKAEVRIAINNARNHREVMRHLTDMYPILRPENDRAIAGKNRYHAKLFDAVSAAHLGKELLRRRSVDGEIMHGQQHL